MNSSKPAGCVQAGRRAVIALALVTLSLTVAVTPGRAASAPDGPGALSHFDLARKDCVGTARNTGSKVWFTVANGVLSDVYYPTHDNTNVETLQYVVTDGSTFTDLQSRDTSYTVRALDPQALDCEVTSTARNGRYRIISDYLSDPANNTVVVRSRFEALVGPTAAYQLYVVFDPSLNGNGGGGSGNGGGDSGAVDLSSGHPVLVASDPNTSSNAVNRSYAVPVSSALDALPHFLQASNGFAGAASDPRGQLDTQHALSPLFSDASNGNLVQGAQVDLRQDGRFTLALGFGSTVAEASAAATASLATPFGLLRTRYEQGWHDYDEGLKAPRRHTVRGVSDAQWSALVDAYWLNANLLKAAEDKSFPGALQAGPTSPWGQAISAGDPNNLYYGAYREVFARDLYEQWTGLMADGDRQTAADAVHFLFYRQQLADGSMPRNSLTNGLLAPDSFNVQLDECSYPLLMAGQMQLGDADLYRNHIVPAANFVISHGPVYGVERWEEQGGYSPSTIAAEVAGLVAAAGLADANHDATSAALWRGVADDWQRSLEGWTVTSNGPLASQPYFLRLSKTGDPNAAISYNVGNGGPTLDQRSVIDQGFLELVRLGLKPANDPAVVATLPVVDATIATDTPSGRGYHRYNGDGYGDGSTDGHPWAPSGQGTGHVWPVLGGERAEYALASGDSSAAVAQLIAMHAFGSGVGLIPEQDWDTTDLPASAYGSDPTVASIGFRDGQAAGSSAPLNWAVAQYVRLMQDISANALVDRPTDTWQRYVAHHQGQTSLSVTAPAALSAVTTASVTVSGKTAAGSQVLVAATDTDQNSLTTTASTVADALGQFSLLVPVSGGTTVLNTVAVASDGSTAHDQRSVVYDFTPGTVLLDAVDPTGDDNGPGNYTYPTAGDFHPGAYDITEFKVILSPDGSTVTFKLQVRDLSPTFGSPLGAQLVDVYVHDPAAASADTSTTAAYPQRNYSVAADSAWSRLIEVQGFGQRYVDAHGTTQGTIAISANAISRYISFSVPTTSLGGTPGSGWRFTVTLTGQDGFSADQARSFASTPQPYNFGVCAAASSDPHCTVDPATVPKVMDVLTPTGVSQASELDYTLGPVVLEGVAIP